MLVRLLMVLSITSAISTLYSTRELRSHDPRDFTHDQKNRTNRMLHWNSSRIAGRYDWKQKDLDVCLGLPENIPDHLLFTEALSIRFPEIVAFYIPGSGDQESSSCLQESDNHKKEYDELEDKDKLPGVVPSEEGTKFQSKQDQYKADKCIIVPPCNQNAKYCNINGTCNNLRSPMWGCATSAFLRLIPAKYEDGEHKERRSQSGEVLPNARALTTLLFSDYDDPDRLNSHYVMQWGQLVSHDTSHFLLQTNGTIDCCNPLCAAHTEVCDKIRFPLNDTFYTYHQKTCLALIRSVTTTTLMCPLRPRQQISTVTHFLDASMVYGSTDKLSDNLREHRDGLLRFQVNAEGREFPPQSDNPLKECDHRGDDEICYKTGDVRANLNTGVSMLQVLLLREHNWWARALKKLNPHWDDEKIFQEARKSVIAICQRITYVNYLEKILGRKYLEEHGLIDGYGDDDFVNTYDELINPTTMNEFATGCYRIFHSMIPRDIELYDKKFSLIETIKMEDFYLRPIIIQEPQMFDRLLRGFAVQHAQSQNGFFTEGITNYFFKFDKTYGGDVVSMDIQRGREHGLGTYNDLRRACGLNPFYHFDEMVNVTRYDAVTLLKSVYESPEDIDLFVGGTLEYPSPGSLVGPTCLCVIGEQFKRWRSGDRFYYEVGNQPGSFTHDQLKEIRKSTLAEVICRNGDDIDRMTLDVFSPQGPLNPIRPCEEIMKMDLYPWKEH